MPVTICFDFGNTRLKYALFAGDQLQSVNIMADDSPETMRSLLDEHKPDRTLLSSVVNHNEELETLLSQRSHFHKLTHESVLPFRSGVGKPETVGADRLALAAAAVRFFPGQHNLVIGLGTAITYNFISKYHEFLGGGISPGMEMRFKSLNHFTALLPLVKADWNYPLLGYDTKTNILSGVLLGMAKEVDGMIEAYSDRYSHFNVVLTGGDATYFAQHLKNRIFADPDFIYKGLYAISECN
jgi:type III pantothenate kinase